MPLTIQENQLNDVQIKLFASVLTPNTQ